MAQVEEPKLGPSQSQSHMDFSAPLGQEPASQRAERFQSYITMTFPVCLPQNSGLEQEGILTSLLP